MDTDLHVLPIEDVREHLESRDCWCDPLLSDEGETTLVIHNSQDGRELIEAHGIN